MLSRRTYLAAGTGTLTVLAGCSRSGTDTDGSDGNGEDGGDEAPIDESFVDESEFLTRDGDAIVVYPERGRPAPDVARVNRDRQANRGTAEFELQVDGWEVTSFTLVGIYEGDSGYQFEVPEGDPALSVHPRITPGDELANAFMYPALIEPGTALVRVVFDRTFRSQADTDFGYRERRSSDPTRIASDVFYAEARFEGDEFDSSGYTRQNDIVFGAVEENGTFADDGTAVTLR